MVSNEGLAVLGSYSNSEPCAITARIAPSTSPCAMSCPFTACAYKVSSTRRAASQPSRDPAMLMWLPRESTTMPSRRSIWARFCPYGPTSEEAARLSSKSMTTCVSGGTCMSRSYLRLGTSEGESDALFGKGSGSNADLVRGRSEVARRDRWREFAFEAVAFETIDSHRQHLSDNVGRGHHMGRLQVSGAADDLAGIARNALEQHVNGGANRRLVEGRLLAVDQFLEPRQSLVHVRCCNHLLQVRRRRPRPRRIFKRISGSVSDLHDKRECGGKIFR